jgi:hypothetical protein
MTSIERTAYPQFRRLASARVLHVFFTPDKGCQWVDSKDRQQKSPSFALSAPVS